MYLKIVGVAGIAYLGAIICFLGLLVSGLYYFAKFRAATLTGYWNLTEFHHAIVKITVVMLGFFVIVIIISILAAIASLAKKRI